MANRGFRLPDDALSIRGQAQIDGYTLAEVERIMGAPAGSIEMYAAAVLSPL